ncbi:MAG: hypothetical protein ACYC6O_07240 [Thermoleophilia bacterium]
MNGNPTNRWKIFGIIVIVLALVLAAFLIGRGCERRKDEDSKTTPTTTRQTTPPASGSQDTGGAPAEPSGSTQDTSTVDNSAPDEVTVVSTHDEIGPCVDGFQEVIHTTEYSNGTSASSISRQPCGIAPVPEP